MEKNDIKFQIVKKTFKVFFAPTLVSALALSIISMTDMVIAGQMLGNDALSAISIVYPIILLVMILSSLFGMGSAIRISTLLGLGDKDGCNRVISSSLAMAIIVTIAISAIGLIFIKPVLNICGATSEALYELSAMYLRPILIGLVVMVLSPIMMTLLRNDSKPKTSMSIVVLCGVVNLSLDIILGRYLGLPGIAWATVIAEALSVAIGAYILFVRDRNYKLVKPRISFMQFKTIAMPGLPVAMIFTLQAVLTTVINHVLMSCAGAAGVASYAILKNLIGFIYAFYDGVTGAMQPMLGIYYGAKENKNVNYVMRVSSKYMAATSLSLFAVLEIFAPYISKLFGASGELLGYSTNAIRIQALFCVTAGIIACLNAYYRSTGRERFALVLSLMDNLLIDIPIIFLFKAITSDSLYCVFIGLVVTDIITLTVWYINVRTQQRKSGSEHLILMDDVEAYPSIFERTFLADQQDISEFLEALQTTLEEADVPMKKEYYINLCMEELVVNVLQLSGSKKDIYVDIAICRLPDEKIQLIIRDNLVQFDPTAVKTDMLDEDDSFNSMGLEIVKRIATEYAYKRTIGMNDFRVIL